MGTSFWSVNTFSNQFIIVKVADIANKFLNRLLLLRILKTSYPMRTVKKVFLKISQLSQETPMQESFLLIKLPIFKNICQRLLLYLHVILYTMCEKDAANNAGLEPSETYLMDFFAKTVNELLFREAATSSVL